MVEVQFMKDVMRQDEGKSKLTKDKKKFKFYLVIIFTKDRPYKNLELCFLS